MAARANKELHAGMVCSVNQKTQRPFLSPPLTIWIRIRAEWFVKLCEYLLFDFADAILALMTAELKKTKTKPQTHSK